MKANLMNILVIGLVCFAGVVLVLGVVVGICLLVRSLRTAKRLDLEAQLAAATDS
jgi:Flp pilus assembly protein TadB